MSTDNFLCIALGVGTKNNKDQWLEVFYPKPLYQTSKKLAETLGSIVGYKEGN